LVVIIDERVAVFIQVGEDGVHNKTRVNRVLFASGAPTALLAFLLLVPGFDGVMLVVGEAIPFAELTDTLQSILAFFGTDL
jgi:hypothetical protein